jgi:type IX secretion system PorP/SprF family membrane protein
MLLSASIVAPAQDIHFSQFGNSPLNLNPGLNGVFGGDGRFVANYRNQWRSVPVPYTTLSGSYEQKFYYLPGSFDRYFTGSVLFHYDKQGSLNLTTLQLAIPLGLTVPLSSQQYLSFAIQPGFGQRSFGSSNISFDEQFVDCFYSPGNPISEHIVRTSLSYFDLGAGINFRTHGADTRSRLDVGIGAHHLNRPRHDFWGGEAANRYEARLERRWTTYAVGLLQVASGFDLMGQAQFQHQGGYREIVYGLGGRFLLQDKKYEELAVQLGVDYRQRYNDALVPHVEVLWRTWLLGLSYDITGSDAPTERRGGFELSLMHRLYNTKVKAKTCEIL